MEAIPVAFDGSEMDGVLQELQGLELQASFNDVRGALRLLDSFLETPLDFFEVEGRTAPGTDQVVCGLKRTERLNDMLTTLRAFQVNRAA